MQIAQRSSGDVLILDLKGPITLGDGDQLLKDTVDSLLNQGHKKFVLNLAEVPYIDSAGLGQIVRTQTNVKRHAGRLILLNVAGRLLDLLPTTFLFDGLDGDEGAEGADVGSQLRPRQPSNQQAVSLPLSSTDSESG